MRTLASVFGYQLVATISGIALAPVCVPVSRADDGTLNAAVAALSTDRKGRTIAGAVVSDLDLNAREFVTFAAVSRAARKAGTPVILGRPVVINPRSRFGVELGRILPRLATFPEMVNADWRAEQHDAVKEGYTLAELDQAIRESYAQ